MCLLGVRKVSDWVAQKRDHFPIVVGASLSGFMPSPNSTWSPSSWQSHEALQQVEYADLDELAAVLAYLRGQPPLITSWEVDSLRAQLAKVAAGESFLLQGGDCAESFDDCNDVVIRNRLKMLLQMSMMLIYGMHKPVVRVGRFAGQFAKPRSAPTETQNGITLPSYRGDNINGATFETQARVPDPQRLIRAYHNSGILLNYVRALSDGGFAGLHNVSNWNLDFARNSPLFSEYDAIIERIRDALRFADTVAEGPIAGLRRVDFYTSHEALHLSCEEAFTRQVPYAPGFYNLWTHFPWIGKRTLFEGSAHVEYMRGIANPVGVKIGPEIAPSDVVALAKHLNPRNELGRLTLITRFGESRVETLLPPFVQAMQRAGLSAIWCCDPMHGNTERADNGIKTRRFDNIIAELELAMDVHASLGSMLGGVHFELTGENVTECVGGASGIEESDLKRAYHSNVDPRLNAEQSLEMALRIVRKFGA